MHLTTTNSFSSFRHVWGDLSSRKIKSRIKTGKMTIKLYLMPYVLHIWMVNLHKSQGGLSGSLSHCYEDIFLTFESLIYVIKLYACDRVTRLLISYPYSLRSRVLPKTYAKGTKPGGSAKNKEQREVVRQAN